MLNGNGTSWSRALAGHRRQRLQVGKEVADVLDRRMLVGRIGKGREIMPAVRRSPLEHRRHEIRFAPPADTVSRIGRDVRDVKRPERRRHGKPAAQLQPVGLVGNGVAGGTAAGIERCDAVGEVRRVSSKRSRGNDRRDRQPPENADAGGASQDQAKENSSQHSPIRHQLQSMASMTALCVISFHEISASGRFGNKSGKRCFEADTVVDVNREKHHVEQDHACHACAGYRDCFCGPAFADKMKATLDGKSRCRRTPAPPPVPPTSTTIPPARS